MENLVSQVVSKLRSEYGDCDMDTSGSNQILVTVDNPRSTGQVDKTIYQVLEDVDSEGSVYFFTDRVSDDKTEVLFSSKSEKPHLYVPRFGMEMGLDDQKVVGPAVRICFSLSGEYQPEQARKLALSSLLVSKAAYKEENIELVDLTEVYGTRVTRDELRSYTNMFSDETDLIEYSNGQGETEGSSDRQDDERQSSFDW